ncbi:hypothetical protein [Nocardia yunnanensis]|uniref:hypothetical protein n=1 Tax=Nocardia yunnanensis TaxID=2382165 RepID=UPI0013C4A489|nr:hypothetical protein [Nocardia yunnanensis]
MNDELKRLSLLAVEYRDIGCTVVEVAGLMTEKHPELKKSPFNLALILRSAFTLSVQDLHNITAWTQGQISRQVLEERLGVEQR